MPDDDLIDLMGTTKTRGSGSDEAGSEESDLDESESERLYPEAYKRDSLPAFAIAIGLMLAIGTLYWNLKGRSGGMQIVAMVAYTFGIPYILSNRFLRYVPWGLLNRFRERFLLVHCVALAVVYGITTLALAVKPRLPDWFVASGRKGSLFELCLLGIFLALAFWECSWISGHRGRRRR
jgi:hypothetical protein